jgi:hypothetical protein
MQAQIMQVRSVGTMRLAGKQKLGYFPLPLAEAASNSA